MRGRVAVVLFGVAGVVAACRDDAGSEGVTPIRITADMPAPSVREALLAEATGNYTYGSARQPIPDSSQGVPGSGFPAMTIASAVRTNDTNRHPGSRFVGRITSAGPYADLGIAPGANYLWTDSVATWSSDSGPSRVLMVPENTAYPMMWLRNDSTHARMTSSPNPEPLLRVLATKIEACTDGCTSGHCSNSITRRAYNPTIDNPNLHITDDT